MKYSWKGRKIQIQKKKKKKKKKKIPFIRYVIKYISVFWKFDLHVILGKEMSEKCNLGQVWSESMVRKTVSFWVNKIMKFVTIKGVISIE